MVPLSMLKDMASLSCTSLLSVLADVFLCIFVFLNAPIEKNLDDIGGISEFILKNSIKPTLFIGLGILSVAMACQHSAFIVYGSLENGTKKRWATVSGYSIGVATVLCAVLGVSGFMGFLDRTHGDILNNFDSEKFSANAARILLAITMLFTYPMESFVGKHVLIALIYNGDENDATFSFWPSRSQRVTFILYIATLIPALIFDDLGPVLSITGSVGGSFISYIIPGLVYLGVNGDEFISCCERMLASYNRRKGGQSGNEGSGSIELPVAGDANRIMINSTSVTNQLDLPLNGTQIDMVTYPSGSKPFWWYLLGYPLWYWIAVKGSIGMKRKLSSISREEVVEDESSSNNGEAMNSSSHDVLVTSPREFHMPYFSSCLEL